MNRLILDTPGGFPHSETILNEMQKAWTILQCFGYLAGNLVRIAGCEPVGASVTDGFVFINGEVLEFKGGLVTSKVVIKEETVTRKFKDNNFKPVLKIRYATFGAATEDFFLWADFKIGLSEKATVASVLALTEIVEAQAQKLDTIEEGAQKNVQANYTQNNPEADDYIKNRPAGQLLTFLHKGTADIGNPNTDDIFTVEFPELPTANYMVVGSLISKSVNYSSDNDVMYVIREKTKTSFKIAIREVAAAAQNLDFDYCLIPL